MSSQSPVRPSLLLQTSNAFPSPKRTQLTLFLPYPDSLTHRFEESWSLSVMVRLFPVSSHPSLPTPCTTHHPPPPSLANTSISSNRTLTQQTLLCLHACNTTLTTRFPGACGKTSLLCSFALGEFPKEYVSISSPTSLPLPYSYTMRTIYLIHLFNPLATEYVSSHILNSDQSSSSLSNPQTQ